MTNLDGRDAITSDGRIAVLSRFCVITAAVVLFISLLVTTVLLFNLVMTWLEHGYWAAPSTGDILVGQGFDLSWIYRPTDAKVLASIVEWIVELPIWLAVSICGVLISLFFWFMSKVG